MTRTHVTGVLAAALFCLTSAGGLNVWPGTFVVAQSPELRPAGASIEALVRQVLEERLAAGDIPDINLLRGTRRIAIRSELPSSRLMLSQDVLPQRQGYDFRLVSTAEASAEAERTKTGVYFLAIDRLESSSETATMWIGTDFVLPSDPKVLKMCCCERAVQYRRVRDRWVFAQWGEEVCR